jgi:hypothetical protein
MTFRLTLPVAAAALVCAAALVLTVSGRPVGAQDAPPDEQMLEQQAMLDIRMTALSNEMNDLEAQLTRMRDVVTQMEQTLREARLAGRSADELAKIEQERAAAQDQASVLITQLEEVRQRYAQTKAEATQWEQRYRLAAQQRERQQAADLLERSTAGRQEAEQRADTVIQEARLLAQGDNAVEAIQMALGESEIEKLRTAYAVTQQRAAQMKLMVESGHASAQELMALAAQADVALAELRQAELRRLLEQVRREQEGFADRANAGQPADEARHEDVLQTAFFSGYLDTVQQYAKLSSDPDAAAVAAVITAADLLRDQEPRAAINYFEPMLTELRKQHNAAYANPERHAPSAVESAVRLQLAEAYNAAGERAKALDVLREIILTNGAAASRPSNP